MRTAHIVPLYPALAEPGKIVRQTYATLRLRKSAKNCYATAQKMAVSFIFSVKVPACRFTAPSQFPE
jgi:hypothetical protein